MNANIPSLVPRTDGRSCWKHWSAGDGYDIVVSGPDRQLSREDQQRLEAGLADSLPSLRLARYFELKPDWLQKAGYVAFALERPQENAVAMLTADWWEVDDCPPFLQLSSVLIARRYRGGTMLKGLLAALFGQMMGNGLACPPTWIILRTCNPIAFSALATYQRMPGYSLYPRLDKEAQDPLLTAMASRIAGHLAPDLPFDPATGVIVGSAVPADFYPALPDEGPAPVVDYMARHLSPADRLLCVALLSRQAVRDQILQILGVDATQPAHSQGGGV